ncbi:uncharacterized protein ACIBXB_018377 isoform 1-T2 [Morphnus guianensis]
MNGKRRWVKRSCLGRRFRKLKGRSSIGSHAPSEERCLTALAHASSSCGVKPGPGTAPETLLTKREKVALMCSAQEMKKREDSCSPWKKKRSSRLGISAEKAKNQPWIGG